MKLQSLAGMSSNCSIDPLNWTNFLLYYVYAGLVHIRPRQTLWHSLMLTKSIFIDFALWAKNYRFFKLKTVWDNKLLDNKIRTIILPIELSCKYLRLTKKTCVKKVLVKTFWLNGQKWQENLNLHICSNNEFEHVCIKNIISSWYWFSVFRQSKSAS